MRSGCVRSSATRSRMGAKASAIESARIRLQSTQPPQRVPALVRDVVRHVGRGEVAVQRVHVAHLRPAGIVPAHALRIGDRSANARPHFFGLGEDPDRVAEGLAHLGFPVQAKNAALPSDDRLGLRKEISVGRIPLARDRAGELQVLALVFPHGYRIRAVEEDVGRLQHRVVEDARRDRLEALRLVLVLRHALELPDRSDRIEEPGQLGVLGHVGLDEDDAPLRVQTDREEAHREVYDVLWQLLRVAAGGDGVVVHDAPDAVVALLHLDPTPQRAQVVPDVHLAARLHAAEDAGAPRGSAAGHGLGH